jgi:hypothetical protein
MDLETERIANDYHGWSPADGQRAADQSGAGIDLNDAMGRIALLERDVAILAGVIESLLRCSEGDGR